jgi:hypothetical protein
MWHNQEGRLSEKVEQEGAGYEVEDMGSEEVAREGKIC